MGLYLCVFDENEEELEGIEVGFYEDFNTFRDSVYKHVENEKYGSKCPVLMNHSDCDGEWTYEESRKLKEELLLINSIFKSTPPAPFKDGWQKQVAELQGITPINLDQCFFDIDGENLIERMIKLVDQSISTKQPILFQ